MHPAVAARAPKLRNQTAMRVWFDIWNLQIEQARDAYETRNREIEIEEARRPPLLETPLPVLCRAGKHQLAETGVTWSSSGLYWRCRACRNASDRTKQRARGVPAGKNRVVLTPAVDREIAEKYVAGAPTTVLAKEYGTYPVTIARALRRHGVPIRNQSEAMRMHYLAKSNNQPGEQISA